MDLNSTSEFLIGHCERSYQYAAIPNQFGDTDLDGVISRMKRFSDAYHPSKQCLDKLEPFLCQIFLPECLPEENKILLPCREDCKFHLQGCLGGVINCNYLPPCEGKHTITGFIDKDTTWFLSNLSVRPAMSASIQYYIRFWNCNPIIIFYYDGQNSTNFHDKYNKEMYGQLFNENLAILLGGSAHRENHWCDSIEIFWEHWDCYGRIEIQDFEPKSYSFSLGCNNIWMQEDLNGLYYEVTIYDESNTTKCVDLNMTSQYSDMSQQSLTDHCEVSYQYAAFPNLFGDTDLDGAISRIKKFLRVYHSDEPSEHFLKKLRPFLCEIVLPNCLPEENKILLPCREDCKFYLEGYLKEFTNCDYLPPCEGRNSVREIIMDNTTWFRSNLSVHPAMSASIEYNIKYPDVPGHHQPIITFYYNGQNSPNLHEKCNKDMHGQLYNENLAIPLCGRYTEKFWCNHKGGMKVCQGRTKIQDFEPKSYFFSLGFECNVTKGNLKGLKYDVTIYDESNKTSCMNLNLTQGQRTDLCELGYQYAAFPNPVGDTDLDEAISYVESFQREFLEGKTAASTYVQLLNKGCLKKLKLFLCEIFLPKCLPKENKILLPCRDTCKSLLEDCSLSTIHGMDVNCDYLLPCPPTYPNNLIIYLSVGACVILVVMVTVCCLRLRKHKGN